MIYTTAHLHDIGKIGVKDYILFKAGRLNKGEWRVIRTHPIVGEEVLRPLSLPDHLPLSIRHHHERWDGSGYPDGIRREAIPLGARIIVCCDAFDALTSPRPYREPSSLDEASVEIMNHAGVYFDPKVAEVLYGILKKV